MIWDEPDSLSGMAGKLGPLMSGAPTLCKFNGKNWCNGEGNTKSTLHL